MLDDAIRAVVHGSPSMYIATRSDRMVPCLSRPQGARLGEKDGDLTLVLSKPVCQPTLNNLRQNAKVAFTATDITNFKTYQLKGRVTAIEEAGEGELALKEIYLMKFETALKTQGYPQSFVEGFNKIRGYLTPAPAWALRVEVEEIFNQTPGPGAGASIWKRGA